MIRLRLSNDKRGSEMTEAREWCRTNAIPIDEAIQQLTGIGKPTPIDQLYADEYRQALHRQDTCLVKMGGPGAIDLLYHLCEHSNAR